MAALAAVVEGDQLRGQGLQAPVPEALIERRGVVADGTDVVHGNKDLLDKTRSYS